MKKFLELVIGTSDLPMYAAFWFFALLGIALGVLLQVSKRNKMSFRTPFHFSWQWLWQDNLKRLITGLILVFIAFRFAPEIFGLELNIWNSLLIGLGNDKIAQALKNKNILGSKLTKDDIAK